MYINYCKYCVSFIHLSPKTFISEHRSPPSLSTINDSVLPAIFARSSYHLGGALPILYLLESILNFNI